MIATNARSYNNRHKLNDRSDYVTPVAADAYWAMGCDCETVGFPCNAMKPGSVRLVAQHNGGLGIWYSYVDAEKKDAGVNVWGNWNNDHKGGLGVDLKEVMEKISKLYPATPAASP